MVLLSALTPYPVQLSPASGRGARKYFHTEFFISDFRFDNPKKKDFCIKIIKTKKH
jgi:hypothetical protein